MSKINFPIGPRAHELIRNRVAAILAEEIQEQAAITYDDDLLNIPVFVHRFKPVQAEEKLPLIIVSLNSGKFDNRAAYKSDGEFPIMIDVYHNSFATTIQRGDTLSSFGAHKVAGVVMGILDNPVYDTLDFPPPFVMSSHVDNFEGGEMERSDSLNLTIVRVILVVKATQKEQLQQAIPIAGNNTTVKLSQSDKGFYYEFNT